MTSHQLESLLQIANPVTVERASGLPVDQAETELLAAVMSEPVPTVPAHRARRAIRRPILRGFGVAVAGAAALVAGIVLTGGSGHDGSGRAWAAEQIRFAEASPLVLLGASGWHVSYADEQSDQEGELHFQRGPDPGSRQLTPGAATNRAQLNWRSGPLSEWLADRANAADVTTTAPVLGTTAHVYRYREGTPGHRDIAALFEYDGRVLEFRAGAADISAFETLLATLRRVDDNHWLSALPASSIRPADRNAVIAQMLKGVPLPPGFDPASIKGPGLTKDRYQLGAAVTETVTCQWFARWNAARHSNDQAAQREAIQAMATAPAWPILKEMAKSGDLPTILIDYAKAMPSGKWYGRPIIGDVNEGLGCDIAGVDLGR